jgi:hypothetical protein
VVHIHAADMRTLVALSFSPDGCQYAEDSHFVISEGFYNPDAGECTLRGRWRAGAELRVPPLPPLPPPAAAVAVTHRSAWCSWVTWPPCTGPRWLELPPQPVPLPLLQASPASSSSRTASAAATCTARRQARCRWGGRAHPATCLHRRLPPPPSSLPPPPSQPMHPSPCTPPTHPAGVGGARDHRHEPAGGHGPGAAGHGGSGARARPRRRRGHGPPAAPAAVGAAVDYQRHRPAHHRRWVASSPCCRAWRSGDQAHQN